MPVVKSTDHIERGLAKLLSAFQKPKIQAWLTAYLRQVQKLEDAVWEILVLRTLDDAEGEVLDVLGRIVGRGRNDLDDDNYRLGIGVQIRINRSQGLITDVVDVAMLSVSGIVPDVTEHQVATITVHYPLGDYDIATIVRDLRKTKALGVRLLVEFDTVALADTFRYDDVAPNVIPKKGFSDVNDLTLGGKLGAVY